MNAPRPLMLIAPYLLAVCLVPVLATGLGFSAAGSGNSAPLGDGAIFVDMVVDRHELYVGESMPVLIEVGAQDAIVASLDNPPTMRGDAFTLNVLAGEPVHEQRMIDGKPYTLLAWQSVLAAVKPGTLSLTIEAPMTVRVPPPKAVGSNPVDESGADDPDPDPAFQSLMQTTAQTLVASSAPISFDVLPLPMEDRPAGFNGAVGHFTISSELSTTRAVVGEPLTLRLHVLGSGNFDRVNSPMLPSTEQWKAYGPSAVFTPAETTGFRGEKRFEQALVATRAGAGNLPGLEFSYFDPQARRYETSRAVPLSIEIAQPPALNIQAPDAAPVPGGHPAFVLLMLLIVALVGVWFKRRRDWLHSHPSAVSGGSSTAELLLRMERAAAGGDTAAFFPLAGRILRQAGALRRDAEIQALLRLVDEVNYGGAALSAAELQRCHQAVLRCVAAPSIQ